ncbi:MAG: hypothetical protein JWN48_4817 [Myxococcaceae bacterium]|nr:hypothetical protein [Myxococcaceae bacterium]
MTDERDPVRLIDDGSAPRALRDALRVVQTEAPSAAQLEALTRAALEAARPAKAPSGTRSLPRGALLKGSVFALGAGLCLALALWWRAPGPGASAVPHVAAPPPAPARSNASAESAPVPPHAPPRAQPARQPQREGADVLEAEALSEEPRVQREAGSLVVPTSLSSDAASVRPRRDAGVLPASGAAPRMQPDSARMRASAPSRGRLPDAGTPALRPAAAATRRTRIRSAPEARSEVALIDRAQQAVLVDPRRTLTLLDEHEREHPRGAFAEEREVLRLDALFRLGEKLALQRRGEAFLEVYPDSVHGEHVRELLHAARAD